VVESYCLWLLDRMLEHLDLAGMFDLEGLLVIYRLDPRIEIALARAQWRLRCQTLDRQDPVVRQTPEI
jgi:hypothetical protein